MTTLHIIINIRYLKSFEMAERTIKISPLTEGTTQ